jgi:hypothetical protein
MGLSQSKQNPINFENKPDGFVYQIVSFQENYKKAFFELKYKNVKFPGVKSMDLQRLLDNIYIQTNYNTLTNLKGTMVVTEVGPQFRPHPEPLIQHIHYLETKENNCWIKIHGTSIELIKKAVEGYPELVKIVDTLPPYMDIDDVPYHVEKIL